MKLTVAARFPLNKDDNPPSFLTISLKDLNNPSGENDEALELEGLLWQWQNLEKFEMAVPRIRNFLQCSIRTCINRYDIIALLLLFSFCTIDYIIAFK